VTPVLERFEQVRLLVVDSSVGVKWFKSEDEPAVDAALDILWEHQTGRSAIFVPGHFPAEVLNGLWYARYEPEQVRAAAEALDALAFSVVPLGRHVTEPAVALAARHGITIHDALFPALAQLLDCELVTADRQQAQVSECAIRLLA
jgi:predicted nucleic acid-binding protein